MSYGPKVYREQGGDKLVVASGGQVQVASGSSFSFEGTAQVASGGSIQVDSGGKINYQAGGYSQLPIQTLGSSQVATNITNFGLTRITGTTTGPTYTLAAPTIAGMTKYIFLNATSSGATHRAVVRSNSTGVSFDTTGGNQITLATSALRGITLVSYSTAAWMPCGVYSGASIAAPRTT